MIEEQKKVIVSNIKRFLEANNMTQSELANKIGIAKSTMSDYMNYRAKPGAGALEKMAVVFGVTKSDIDTTYKNKTVEIINGKLELVNSGQELVQQYVSVQNKKIPILGKIAAGTPIEAIQDIVEEIAPPYETKNIKELFGLVVDGESMNKVIPNGHYAILRKQETVENGEIAAVIVNGCNATLKRVYKFTDLIILEPYTYDDTFKDQQYSKDNCDEVKIIGKFLYSVSPIIQ